MAIRARLTAPQPAPQEWPWHEAKVASLPVSLMLKGDRRMEAENYLASGFGIRLSFEAHSAGCARLDQVARVWQPSRLKGIQVGPAYGTPFLGATQVFDLRPIPRKYLALERTDDATNRFTKSGSILVTCSGSVGRTTLAHTAHEEVLISHDLLRIDPLKSSWWGWIYAYLHAPQARQMMLAAQYGHIIKHLEVSHLNELPIPRLKEPQRKKFHDQVSQILNDRSRSSRLTAEAEEVYEKAFPSLKHSKQSSDLGFTVSAADMFKTRRRLDAARFAPSVEDIVNAFKQDALQVVPLSAVTNRVFVPGRFKHIYGDGGIPYLDSADILEVNPDIKKFVLSLSEEEQEDYHVEAGWIIIPCSGQVYGNIGHSVMATDWHVGKVLTNHIMRVCPSDNIRSGYLLCSLGHPELGRPQIVRHAFGSSVPEISPDDVSTVQVPRLSPSIENKIADLMEEASAARDEADALEVKIAGEAEHLIDQFLVGHTDIFDT